MGMLSDEQKEYLRKELKEKLRDEVRLVVFTQEMECQFCKETREIAEDLATVAGQIKVEKHDFEKDAEKARELGIEKIPATAIMGRKDYGIRFYGVPSGYEFRSLIDAIVDVSRGGTSLSQETKKRLAEIREPVHIQVFVTPTCPYCPRAVRLAHQMAIESEYVRADMVEVVEFPHLAQKYSVMAVPKIVINEEVEFTGAVPEPHFLNYVLHAIEKAPHS